MTVDTWHVWQVWDDELARVAQKWSDQCADVDYNGDYKRLDPALHHDPHPQRKTGESALDLIALARSRYG